MPITINGSGTITGISAGGLPDGSITTADIADANITAAKLDGAQSGSAPIYAARAWVNFNGTGTVAIRASGNVSSITDNGAGDYTANFATAMPDANYAISALQGTTPGVVTAKLKDNVSPTTSGVRVIAINTSFADTDAANISVAIFR